MYTIWGKQCYACVPVFDHTDLEQNLFFLALFKPIILQFFTILQDKLERTIKKFPKSPTRPAARVLTFVKHQICSPSCRSRLNEHVSFNIIENLLCLGFIFLYLWFCYVIFRRSILSTPACDALLYCWLKTTCTALKLRKRLLTISKINITRWNMYRDNNFHSRR